MEEPTRDQLTDALMAAVVELNAIAGAISEEERWDVEALLAAGRQLRSEDPELQEDDVRALFNPDHRPAELDDDEEPDHCGTCGGSGGGDHPGIRCRTCGGSGDNPAAVQRRADERAEHRAELAIDDAMDERLGLDPWGLDGRR